MAPPDSTRIAVQIIDVKGLYLPGYPDSSPRPPGTTRAAGYKPGYKSLDNQGRIYINHDLEGRWKSDTQLIEITVTLTVLEGVLPEDARIRWSVRDVDDPFDERPEVHPASGPYLDPNDYATTGAYVSPAGDDNEGTLDQSPRWEAVESYPLSDATEKSATTAIAGMTSKIRLHTTDIAGDNLILRVDLDTAARVEATGDETGIMTLWHRLDLEYVRMESALPLPACEAPKHFEPAFTQLDCAAERVIPDRRYIALDQNTLGESSSRFIAEVFSHWDEPGWFCLVGAMEPYPLPEVRGEVLFNGPVTIEDGGTGDKRGEYIEIPGSHANAAYVSFRWDGEEVAFEVAMLTILRGPPERTRLWLAPHDIQPRFTAGDGSVAHAYATRIFFYPRARRLGTAFEPPGYGIPERVLCEVRSEGAFYAAGLSPTIDLGDMRYFAGRTILFTHHGAFRDAASGAPRPDYQRGALRAIVHELVHAFGMPHKCGYFDYRAPRRTTCCMNYSPNWMLNADLLLIAGTSRRVGNDMCGRHLKEVRRVHLEENMGLRWK